MRLTYQLSFFFFYFFSTVDFSYAADAAPPPSPDRARIEWPNDEPATPELIELGKTLFFDQRLSGNQTVSCATCHNPDLGFSDGLPLSVGAPAKKLGRRSPHLYNLAWARIFMWDGRQPSLEEQALGPIGSADEMGMDLSDLEKRLNAVPFYSERFKSNFKDGLTRNNIGIAIAAFERTIIVDDTPYDRWKKGNADAMGPEAKRGLTLFLGKAKCISCHSGPNFTDESFHNLGFKTATDRGRAAIVPGPSMEGAFKTPGLRNVTQHAPYMHDGSEATIASVIEFYDRGGDRPGSSPLIKPLNLSDIEKRDLIAFLGALSQPLVITRPRIP